MTSKRSFYIGYSQGDPQIPFRAVIGHAARERAEQQGQSFALRPAFDVEQQITTIEALLRENIDALIVAPLDSQGIVPAIMQANRAGVPVISVDMAIWGGQIACNVSSDNLAGGRLAGERLADLLGGRGKLLHLQGLTSNASSVARSQGFQQAVAAYADLQVAVRASAEWQTATAATITAQTLREHPDLGGIFAENDDMAVGALAALKAADRLGKVAVIGFDAQPEALRAIYEGTMAGTVAQSARLLGRAATDAALSLAAGTPPAPEILIPVTLVNHLTMIETVLETLDIVPGLLRDVVRKSEEQRRLQEQIITTQQSVIRMLSSPLVPVSDGVLVLPLIGSIDSARAQQVIETLLTGIAKYQAEFVIIDITGVPLVDTQIAHYLLQATRAVQLLGTTTILVGITAEVAQTIVQLGIDLSAIITRSTLQHGIEYASRQRARR